MYIDPVIVKIKNKWFLSKIENGQLKKMEKFNKLSEINVTKKTFKKFLKENELSENDFKKIIENNEVQSIYFSNKSCISLEKENDKKYWSKFNSLCLKCKKSCKQSYKVDIIKCPLIEKNKK